MANKCKPNFLVVGAAKSGTTSLFHYLNQHPDIYIPEVKECRFFSQLSKDFNGLGAEFFPNTGITDEEEYFKLFENQENKVCGDISNDYLYYYEQSIKNIKKHLDDDVKIIIILRNPIDRAYSNYMHAVRDDWENLTFEESIIQEEHRIKSRWAWPYHYVKTGFYYSQVKAYLENFTHVKIYLYEDFKDQSVFLDDLFDFLEIKNHNVENKSVFNASGYPKSKLIHKFVNNDSWIKTLVRPLVKTLLPKNFMRNLKNNNLKQVSLDSKTRTYLEAIYFDDVQRLSSLIGRDLTHWINNEM